MASKTRFLAIIAWDCYFAHLCAPSADRNIVANEQGNRVTPSFVAFSEKERLIGDAAKNQAALNPRNTVFDAKYVSLRDAGNRNLQCSSMSVN